MRHLLSAADLDKDQAIKLLDLAEDMSDVNDREIKKLPTLRGKTVVNSSDHSFLAYRKVCLFY